MTLTDDQIAAADGLFNQLDNGRLSNARDVFVLYGMLLGEVKEHRRILREREILRDQAAGLDPAWVEMKLLRKALRWFNANGASWTLAEDPRSGYSDGGCGCCAEPVNPPAELVPLIDRALHETMTAEDVDLAKHLKSNLTIVPPKISIPEVSDPTGDRRLPGMMKLHADSHLDHGLTARQLAHILLRFADRDAFFIETIELPEELGTVPCALYGPIMGDDPITDHRVVMAPRGTRAWPSRMLSHSSIYQPRPTRLLTVIGGPSDGDPCVLYTAFGGPQAPQEPGDIRRQIEALEEERRARPVDPANGASDPDERGRLDPLYGKLLELRKKRDESDRFWSEHALVYQDE